MMEQNRTTIIMIAACLSFLGGCDSQDVAKQAIIILAKSSAMPNDKSAKDKLAEMSSDENFENYYEGVCAEAGYKTGSHQMRGCISKYMSDLQK
tara:strand:- start:87 stop:368 length:282 start_codon:yes stop_codon:yes gene_type:complete